MSFAKVTTLPQAVILAVVPAISGALSLSGSVAIVWMIARGHHWKTSIKYRLLLGICLNDVVQSTMFLGWSLWIPKGTPGVWGAMGNPTTCNIQGFLFSLTTIGNFYNAALAGYYWLCICHSLTDQEIARRYERPTHVLCIVWPLVIAIAPLYQDFYGPSSIGCWMTPTPLHCERDDDCTKGHYAYRYAWIYAAGPLLFLGLFIAFTMIQIYRRVRATTRASQRYDFSRSLRSTTRDSLRARFGDSWSSVFSSLLNVHTSVSRQSGPMLGASVRAVDTTTPPRSATLLRETMLQSFLYIGAYIVSHIFVYVCCNVELLGGVNPYWTLLLQNWLYPLQGFFNVFIFLRPRVAHLMKQQQNLSLPQACYVATFRYEDDPQGQHQHHPSRTSSSMKSAVVGPIVVSQAEESNKDDDAILVSQEDEQSSVSVVEQEVDGCDEPAKPPSEYQ